MSALITCEELTKIYHVGDQQVVALDRLSVRIERGEFVGILGTSGSGKSTLMGILGCLDSPTSGHYFLDEVDVSNLDDAQLAKVRNQEIGFIFQSFNLLPRLTALENVAKPLSYRGVAKNERLQAAELALERVGLKNRMLHLPNELSGGQRQRVAIARALCGNPAILLADEPTGNLDSTTSNEISDIFDELHALGHTIVLITHEPSVANRCRRLLTLEDGRLASDQMRTDAYVF